MTIQKNYSCDLCGQDDFARRMLGVKYTGDSSIFTVSKEQSTTHICERCIESIKNFKG